MKKYFICFFLIFFSKLLYSNEINLNGTWINCYKELKSISCSNSNIEDYVKSYFQNLINYCSFQEISQSNDIVTISNFLDKSKTTEGTFADNILKFQREYTTNGADVSDGTECTMNNNHGNCIINAKVNLNYYGFNYICNLTLQSEYYKVFLSEDNTSNDLIKSLGLFSKNQWQLLGTTKEIEDMSIFNNVKSVWVWDEDKWKIYSSDNNILNLLEEYDIPILTNIKSNRGFWVLF